MTSYLLFLIIIVSTFSLHAVEPPQPLSLQAAFELAIVHSETLGLREQDVKIAEERYWQALSGALPKATLVGSQRWDDRVNHRIGGGSSSSSSNSKLESWESKINLTQPLFHGFREFNAAAAAKADGRARTQDLRNARQQLYLDVAESFYQYLMEKQESLILAEMESALDTRVKELERREKLGRSRTSEVLLARADLADVRASQETTRRLLAATGELLSFLTGIPSDKLVPIDSTPIAPTPNLQSYLSQIATRPDLLAAKERITSSQRQLSATKAEHMPSVNVEGNVELQQDPRTKGDWDVALTIQLPLFEGGLTEARIRENKALVRQSELTVAQLQRSAQREVRTRHAEFNQTIAEIVRLRELVVAADENQKVQKEDYKRGISSNLEVLDSVRRYHEARRRLNTSEHNAKISLIQLHIAAGNEQAPLTSGKEGKKQ